MSKIIKGLEDAVSYAKGDKSKGKSTVVKVGKIYRFSKSGNLVRVVSWHAGKLWTVERVDGASAGKEMLVHERTLTQEAE